ncbi:hypothetical protein BDN72DRAFT_963813 [Pluteus cervinus]|uniref:Uncharacterized protein n=1 Tax=Pluteus cervinus TaxID=181527 RepID=A0ACD3ADD7_9AGAR|nr:hypothetical protein BDN72DRAFT_963813 [Pluteus cervinus]
MSGTTMNPYSNLFSFNLDELSLEDVYKQIDKEITQLQERLCSLRTFRNSLPPISKIPTEILSKIFSESQEPIKSSFLDEVDLRSRFCISWVCRHWRRTALATPNLWTIISKKNRNSAIDIDFAQQFLVRSRDLKISVNIFQPTRDLLSILASHMHRTEHLRMVDVPMTLESDILFLHPTPVLFSLDLSNTHIPYESDPEPSGIVPQLHHLSISAMHFETPSPLITPTLRSLRIINTLDGIDVNYLLRMLPLLENLTELVLVSALEDQDVTIPTERILLPRLESLTLSESNRGSVFDLLDSLNVPQTAITLIWPEDFETVRESVDDFFGFLRAYLSDFPFPIHHLKIEREYPDLTIEISGAHSQHRYSIQFPKQKLSGTWTDQFVSWVLSLDSLNSLETLSTTELPERALHVLKRLPNLARVTLFGFPALREFLGAFHFEPGTTQDTLFPAVKELTISKLSGSPFVGSLLNALVSRYEAKMGLQRLVFLGSPGVDVDMFKDVVSVISVVD